MAVKRLIETFVPENYKIFLDIDRKTKTFKGQVAIHGEAKSDTVYFHAKDLKISSVKAFSVDADFSLDAANEEVAVKLDHAGDVTVSFEYEAVLTDNMMGIYPSYYEVDGVKKMLVGTQFESHFARQAFPSIDEPEAKATFDLSVKFDEEPGDIIVANMPEVSNENGIHTFDTTVRMSSYLLAFVFGDMQYKKAKTKSGVEVGTFSTKAHAPEVLDFPLDIAVKSIEFYEDYYQTPYPLPHSWHVALPDFSAGAMENWGCITYREVCMLVDPNNATVASKQYVATVIAHELAHQWFGDLVTMQWWDDLWLNESFANNMEYVAIDAIHPEWKVWESFSIKEASLALDRDATDGVQSVHVDVNHPDEIGTLFDPAIVYAKGSRLMVMLRKWLGDKDFAEGLRLYFAKHQYGNTVGDDLWNALAEASGKDVASFMHSWVNQPGYPVVTAEVVNDSLVLSQKQFFIGEGKEQGRLWNIPLNSNWTGLPDLLSEEKVEIPGFTALKEANRGKALFLNDANMAHYIIDYKGELLTDLLENLAGLEDVTKFQLIQDRKLLAKAELISYADVVEMLPYFINEESYIVGTAISQLLGELDSFIDSDTELEATYKSLVGKLFAKNYARLGWKKQEGESAGDESLRGTVLARTLYAENESAIAQARSIFADHKENLAGIPADIRPIVLNNEIKQANDVALVDSYMDLYVKTSLQELKRELANAVANIKDEEAVAKLLDNMKNADIVKPQDIAFSWLYLLNKDFSQDAAWAWETANWDWLAEKLGGDMSYDKFVIYPGNHFKTAEKLAEYKAFFEPKLSNPGLKRSIEMAIKQIEARVKLIENQKAGLEAAIVAVEGKL
ncbi:M1 family metallopeptidase [Lactococcus termiticola]|uniref:Aminopeptidase n=1 Tax=Lactococcus termiticola TaxID=2169526 RepID=A0A2R5HDE9_9LACT|nr:M1 family metallopeptidase [Lactococcus termiticola]GBG96093.1 aminopeptidase N [Lactococcus termiticola]